MSFRQKRSAEYVLKVWLFFKGGLHLRVAAGKDTLHLHATQSHGTTPLLWLLYELWGGGELRSEE